MNLVASRSTFDIRNFVDRLTPAKGKDRYHCPVCEGDNLTFNSDKYEGYTCWNDESDRHRAEIKEALSPWSEVLEKRKQPCFTRSANKSIQASSRTYIKSTPQPVQLPQSIALARIKPATDAPQSQERTDKKRGKVQVTTYSYSPSQWVERKQWDNPEKQKGHSKDFFPWHLGANDKPVCKKGEADWLPYRWQEAITAAKTSRANAVLVVEGEGCVEAYRAIGLAAVTLQGSAWGSADLGVFASQCKTQGLAIVFHPDHDTTGEQKAGKLARACEQVGVPCLILNPLNLCAELPESGDVVDLLKMMDAPDYVKRLEAELHAAVTERQNQDAQNQQGQERVKDDPIKAAAMAAELAEDYRSRIAWNDEGQSWYRYEADFDSMGVWSAESEVSVGAVILAEIESRIGLNYTANYLSEVVKLLKLRLLVRKWEEPKGMLPFRNGVLKWDTGEFLPHSPGYRFTYVIPRDHNPLAAEWQVINDWMNQATGNNTKLKNILLCWLNACLKGRADLQRFLHLVGAGGTGKGTFMRLAIDMIGSKNHHSSSLQDWCGNRFESANAYKKRLLVFSDEDKFSGGLGNFKKLTGGDALRGEMKNKTAFHYTYEGMAMVASNYPIFAGDNSSGMARRVLMVPFNNVVSPGRRRNLEAEFEPELSALTNYVMAIPDEVVSQTLRQSVDQSLEVIETTWEYRMRMDSVTAWLNECVIPNSSAAERVGVDKADEASLFGSYFQYCDRTGSRAKGSREFSPALLDLVNNILHWGVEKKRSTGGFMIYGLSLRQASDSAEPYCIEALSTHVGSDHDVGSNVGSNVGSEPLPREGYVGYVGSTNFFEENQNKDRCSENINGDLEVISKELGSPTYIPYISQSEQVFEPCIPILHMQDENPTLPQDAVQRAVDRMVSINSVESFQEFHDRFQRCSQVQQQQILNAFTTQVDPEIQSRFYESWNASEIFQTDLIEAQVKEAQSVLEGYLDVADYHQALKKYGQSVIGTASERLSEQSKKTVERIANFIQKNG